MEQETRDMQCWIFRAAQRKWHMNPAECAELFRKYDVMGFVSDCYDILHLSSYRCALEDVEEFLRYRGVKV